MDPRCRSTPGMSPACPGSGMVLPDKGSPGCPDPDSTEPDVCVRVAEPLGTIPRLGTPGPIDAGAVATGAVIRGPCAPAPVGVGRTAPVPGCPVSTVPIGRGSLRVGGGKFHPPEKDPPIVGVDGAPVPPGSVPIPAGICMTPG